MSETWIYGVHAVSKRLQRSPRDCVELRFLESGGRRIAALSDQARDAGVKLTAATRAELTRLLGSDRHQGVAMRIRGAATAQLDLDDCLASLERDSLLLVLDGVQDPHNLGACLRTADACGVAAVIIPKNRAVGVNATVRKVAAGAAESVPVIEVTNLARGLERLRQAGVWLYGTSEDAPRSIFDCDFDGPVALVMGAEGQGLRRLTREACDFLVSLPMLGQVESLNVSVATGVCLYQILRGRRAAGSGG